MDFCTFCKCWLLLGGYYVDKTSCAIVKEDSDLDDETMFKLDVKLAAAFRSLRKGTKLDKDKVIQLQHYKMRFCFTVPC